VALRAVAGLDFSAALPAPLLISNPNRSASVYLSRSDRILPREASIVIVEFELVLAMMNDSISAERALHFRGTVAAQTCAPEQDLGQHPGSGLGLRKIADFDSWRSCSASPVSRY
jgi:hypothetical protein